MQVQSQNNSYASMNMYQQPVETRLPINTLPEEPVVEASPELSPEDQLQQDREKQAALDAQAQESQEKKDAQREYAVGYVAHESKQTQVEIYLSVMSDSKVELGSDDLVSTIEILRDVQKENNAVAAYATYQENQNAEKATLY